MLWMDPMRERAGGDHLNLNGQLFRILNKNNNNSLFTITRRRETKKN